MNSSLRPLASPVREVSVVKFPSALGLNSSLSSLKPEGWAHSQLTDVAMAFLKSYVDSLVTLYNIRNRIKKIE